jgi:serine/threonine protein kinase
MTEETENRRPLDISSGLLNNRYELLEFLGQGSMGAVYKAHDRELDRTVAIKCVLNVDEHGSNERAMREAKTLANLSHPNIIRVYDVLTYKDQVSLVTEWIEGRTLNELSVPIGPAEVIAIATQLFRGLAAAHRMKIFHRDIKPANIILARDGRLVLLDFGVAFSPGMSSGETMAGSLRYAAPAVLEGHPPSEQSDIFAAALVVSELLIGYALVPDLAPLPLYRFHREKFSKSARRAFNGIYPPLAIFLRERLFNDGQVAIEPNEAERCAAFMHELFRELTDKTVEDYLEACVWRAAKDDSILDRLSEKTESALEDQRISPKDKALWFAFQEHFPKSKNSQSAPSVRQLFAKLSPKSPFSSKALWRKRTPIVAASTVLFLLLLGMVIFRPFSLPSEVSVQPEQQVQAVKNAVKEAVREAVQEAVNEEPAPQVDQNAGDVAKGTPPRQEPGSNSNRTANQNKMDRTLNKLGGIRSPKPQTAEEWVSVQFAANAWADISIDGLNVGRLPSAESFKIRVGTRKVRLESPLVEPLETEILVTRAPEQRFKFSLKPKSAVRIIRLANPGQLIIDGTDHGFGSEKTITMTYGSHEIWIKRGDLGVEKKQIAIGPDTPEVIVVE